VTVLSREGSDGRLARGGVGGVSPPLLEPSFLPLFPLHCSLLPLKGTAARDSRWLVCILVTFNYESMVLVQTPAPIWSQKAHTEEDKLSLSTLFCPLWITGLPSYDE